MKQLNIYESPEILILELEKKDIIATSIGDGSGVEVGGEDWEF